MGIDTRLTMKENKKRFWSRHGLEALSPYEIDLPACRWGHRWAIVTSCPAYSDFIYKQCRKCFDRIAICKYKNGYSVPDTVWLSGGAMNDRSSIPPPPQTRSCISSPPTPESTQVVLHEGSKPKTV